MPFAAAPCGGRPSRVGPLEMPPAAVGELVGSTSQTSAARSVKRGFVSEEPRRVIACHRLPQGSMAQPSAGRSLRARRPAFRIRIMRALRRLRSEQVRAVARRAAAFGGEGPLLAFARCAPSQAAARARVVRTCVPNGSTSQTSAARSRPLAEGCTSPKGSLPPPLGCGLCDRFRSLKGSAGRSHLRPAAASPLEKNAKKIEEIFVF